MIGEPWRAPGTRMIGFFKTAGLHDCGSVDNVGIFLFVNPTDLVFGTTPCPIWVVAYMDYDKNIHTSHAFVDPATAEALHYQLIAAAEAGCDECW